MAPRSKHSGRKSSASIQSHRSTLSLAKTEVIINVYDLLPPGRLASALWLFGSSLLHSAVVIKDKEFAFGGTEEKGVSGVYWTRPRTEPPGGTFKAEILHGFTFRTEDEIQNILREVSEEFDGASYNLLTKNCNHFTSTLCERLTSRAAPKWINRAAGIGLALPCIVPKQWVQPPDHETASGELVDADESQVDSNSGLLDEEARIHSDVSENGQSSQTNPLLDTNGRVMPPSEVAP